MTPDPAILLDVSRLVSRLGQGPATGIDRVEAEWLAHLQSRPHLLLCRVEHRPPRLDLDCYPYLPKATVEKTRAGSYLRLLSGDAEDAA